jgi:hypothetical protein
MIERCKAGKKQNPADDGCAYRDDDFQEIRLPERKITFTAMTQHQQQIKKPLL